MTMAFVFFTAAFFGLTAKTEACVGKNIIIAVSDSPSEQILAHLVSVLLSERTGTHVEVKTYSNNAKTFDAVTEGEAGILIENTQRALSKLGEKKKLDSEQAYSVSKAGYRKRFSLIWLEPFGPTDDKASQKHQYGPVITTEIMRNFPALPRVVNKLAGAIEVDMLFEMTSEVESGKEPKSIARDYLILKRLI